MLSEWAINRKYHNYDSCQGCYLLKFNCAKWFSVREMHKIYISNCRSRYSYKKKNCRSRYEIKIIENSASILSSGFRKTSAYNYSNLTGIMLSTTKSCYISQKLQIFISSNFWTSWTQPTLILDPYFHL